jgi:MFS family permease
VLAVTWVDSFTGRALDLHALGTACRQAGVLLGGVLARWAPAPEVTPFAAGMIVCALAAAALVFVPETAERQRGGLRIRRPRVPEEIRGAFARVSLTAAAVWAVAAGLFLAVMPSYAGQLVLHSRNLALLGLVAALVLVSSVAAQLAVRRGAPPALAQAAGLVLFAAGLAAVATSLFTAIATFAAITGGGALVLAAWHLRHRGEASRQTTPDAVPDQHRTRHPVRSSR